jgi:hypothetical protein
VQELHSTACRDSLKARAHCRVGARSREQTPSQSPIVETGATDEDRPSAPGINVVDGSHRVADVLCRRVLLERLDDVDDVMRDTSPLSDRHLVGADVEATVDGGGIAADDFAAACQRDVDPKRALAGSGRPKDGEDRRAQGLHPDESESHDGPEENQESELLRARGKRHPVT